MKKVLFLTTIILSILTACDDTTDTLGTSLTNPVDNLSVSVDTFSVSTRSVKANAVLCRSLNGYLGKIKDPETGNYVTGDFLTQFSLPEANYFHPIDSLVDKVVRADSCEMNLYFGNFYGDSLTTMKATVYELEKPMEESERYYSDFDPVKEGYVREDGLKSTKTYSLIDYYYSDSLRNSSGWMNLINIPLNDEYTDQDGKVYNNYGTYLMTKYYENREKYYADSYAFIHNVCPGFYIKSTGGVGAMAEISLSRLNIYYKTEVGEKKYIALTPFYGTEEVLQGTRLSNNDALDKLIDNEECTYIKSPAGIYTELTLPILEIAKGHENDTISSAKIMLRCLNDIQESEYNLPKPSQLMLVEADSVANFFEKAKINDDERTYLASYTSQQNSYIFTNISILVNRLYKDYLEGTKNEGQNWLEKHPNWNKVYLVPVTTETAATSTTVVTTRVTHNLSLASTRLIGGPKNPNEPVKISIIYSKFEE